MSEASDRLRLRTCDIDDLRIVSSCLQDAIVPLADMAFLPEQRAFVMVANRFMWERAAVTDTVEDGTRAIYYRTNCGVRFLGVSAVLRKNIDHLDRSQLLELLSIDWSDEGAVLLFAGGATVRLSMAVPCCLIEDVEEPWPTTRRPCHRFEPGDESP